jgi:magnesium transporter
MLRMFGPGTSDAALDVDKAALQLSRAVWIDLLEPTREEEQLVERLIGTNVPTREEMQEIEPSSRLYQRNGATFMTTSVLYGVHGRKPSTDPVSFILTRDHLLTIRYVDPAPFIAFVQNCRADASLAANPLTVLAHILEAIVDRLADEFEESGRELEAISSHIFERKTRRERRNPELHYEALMLRIGSAGRLIARARESSVSTGRMLSFLAAQEQVTAQPAEQRQLQSISEDLRALGDHSNFLAENLNFLLDASLGMISLEQNLVMKIFSVVAVVLMPPTLIAGIYGMNFRHMPELSWVGGYPWAVGLMLASAIFPYLFARRRGWL